MYNYKLTIEYDGRDFQGWQRQTRTRETIQEQIEIALQKLLKEKITITGAGRTDSGVSASNQAANFHFKGKLDTGKFNYSLNAVLPGAITIKKINFVPENFSARYSAKKREYLYRITCSRKSIDRDYYFNLKYKLDFDKIDEFLDFIRKQEFFRSFCKNNEDKRNFLCKIFSFKYRILKEKNEIIFSITANRFLHSMVRCLIGCCIEIGRGKLKLEDIKLKSNKGEKIAAHYLPGNALILNKIYYK